MIESYIEQEQKIDKLLTECNELESELTNAYLEGNKLVGQGVGMDFLTDGARNRLANAVEAARSAERTIEKWSTVEKSDDAHYLDAARAAEQELSTNQQPPARNSERKTQ